MAQLVKSTCEKQEWIIFDMSGPEKKSLKKKLSIFQIHKIINRHYILTTPGKMDI